MPEKRDGLPAEQGAWDKEDAIINCVDRCQDKGIDVDKCLEDCGKNPSSH